MAKKLAAGDTMAELQLAQAERGCGQVEDESSGEEGFCEIFTRPADGADGLEEPVVLVRTSDQF